MKIAIVILNWNGVNLLKQFLPSIVSHSDNASIYLIDNNSDDESVAYVTANHPQIKTILLSKNHGYAKGYNLGLKAIDADIFCLLNNDVKVTKGWTQDIKAEFYKNPKVGIIQPKIKNYHKKNHFEYAGAAGGFIDRYGYPYCRGRRFDSIQKDIGQYDENSDIFWASGACFFIRKNVFEKLGGFDESFEAHMEEIDLCWRALNDSQKVRYVYSSVVYHIGAASLPKSNPKKTFLNFRNSLFILIKNTKSNPLPIVISRLILDGLAGIKFLVELKPLHFLAIIKAHFSMYARLKTVLKQRQLLTQKIHHYNLKSIIWEYFILGRQD